MGCSGSDDGSGTRYPFAPSQQGEDQSCRAGGLSLARRYNTLDLAGKVSVPRGCGPFGNPGDEGRRRLGDGMAASRPGLRRGVQAVTDCREIAFLADGIGDTFGAQGSGWHVTFFKSVITHYAML